MDYEKGEYGQHSNVRDVQKLEAVINEGIRAALLEETPDRSLEVLLEKLGKALNGERTYIFERNASDCDDNTYEWTADGVNPEIDSLQNVPPKCAPAGIAISASAGISSSRIWKISGRRNPCSMRA